VIIVESEYERLKWGAFLYVGNLPHNSEGMAEENNCDLARLFPGVLPA
jgi:hypothetical protein